MLKSKSKKKDRNEQKCRTRKKNVLDYKKKIIQITKPFKKEKSQNVTKISANDFIHCIFIIEVISWDRN